MPKSKNSSVERALKFFCSDQLVTSFVLIMKLWKLFVRVNITLTVLASATDYKFIKVENFSSSNEEIAVFDRFDMTPKTINISFTVKQPVEKIQVKQ